LRVVETDHVILNKYILPRWQHTPLAEVRPMFVQDGLDELLLSPKSKGKIRRVRVRQPQRNRLACC